MAEKTRLIGNAGTKRTVLFKPMPLFGIKVGNSLPLIVTAQDGRQNQQNIVQLMPEVTFACPSGFAHLTENLIKERASPCF